MRNLKPARQALSHITVRMIRAVSIASRRSVTFQHKTAIPKILLLSGSELCQIEFSMSADDQMSARPDNPAKLIHPKDLDVFGKMRKHGERIHQAELPILISERWSEFIGVEARKLQMIRAPLDRFAVGICAVQAWKMIQMPNDPAAAATKIENRVLIGKANCVCFQRVKNCLSGHFATPEKSLNIWNTCYQPDQAHGRDRPPIFSAFATEFKIAGSELAGNPLIPQEYSRFQKSCFP